MWRGLDVRADPPPRNANEQDLRVAAWRHAQPWDVVHVRVSELHRRGPGVHDDLLLVGGRRQFSGDSDAELMPFTPGSWPRDVVNDVPASLLL